MKKLFYLFLMMMTPGLAMADATEWQTRYDESTITITSTENGNSQQTKVGAFTADIKFSPDDLENSAVSVEIPVESFQRDDSEALQTMMESMFFDVTNYPNILYTADTFDHTGENTYLARGQLTIKDKTEAYDLPFTLNIDGDVATMDASTTVKRLPFEIGKGSWADTSFIADDAQVDIHLVADKKTP